MSEPRIIRVGVVGVGALGQHHARIYSQMESVQLVGLYDADRARAAELAAKHGTRAFDTLEQLADAVEAANVAVPTHLHHEVASALIQRGVHVLVEKPIAATTQEAEDLVRQAQEKGVILQVGHVERFNPVLGFLEEHAAKPRFIEAHRLAPFPPPREGLHPRGTEVNVVLDLMIHDLEIILHLVGEPVRDVRAVGVPVLSGSEDIANVRLLFENGCVANITASRISPERMRKIRVFTEDAYLSLDYQNQAGELFRKSHTGIAREEVPIEKGEPLALELQSFVRCVQRRDRPVVSGEHAAEALRLAVEITRQMRQGPS
ncbi:MAG: Gfo/Idh/MocA family oxidoreductase [Kiritimatiellae bacterium]|nr:Gfo/Idh/MocA family oxidoreductase [Kiritimatiellia bacterium]MCO5069182.1 Gfo/Idh/MocA family oxidoreductase [Kiritimatiellia bacterium]